MPPCRRGVLALAAPMLPSPQQLAPPICERIPEILRLISLVPQAVGLDQKLVARELNERSEVQLVKLVARFLMNRANH